MALWASELDELIDEIEAARLREVTAFLLTFGAGERNQLPAVPHRLVTSPRSSRHIERKLVTIASDRRYALVGAADGEQMSAIHSEDPAVILVVIEYIRHDIALQKLAARIGIARVREIWEGDEILRELASDGPPGVGPAWTSVENHLEVGSGTDG
jgi:hypothetical protein